MLIVHGCFPRLTQPPNLGMYSPKYGLKLKEVHAKNRREEGIEGRHGWMLKFLSYNVPNLMKETELKRENQNN